MNAKEELREIFYREKEIRSLLDQIEETRTKLERITPILSDMPTSHGEPDKIAEGVIELIELREVLKKRVKSLSEHQKECHIKICRIKDVRFRTILHERYFNKKTFEQISTIINYNYYNTIKLHGMALRAYSKTDQEIPTSKMI